MSSLIYEHPLNEKVRTYLRLEQLFKQLSLARSLEHPLQQQSFFRSLFELSEVLERSDWRSDTLKDMAQQSKKLQQWAELPGVDSKKIQFLLDQFTSLSKAITKAARLGDHLKEDRLLASVRQRVSLPGGNCSFDLPYLHQWLHQAPEQIQLQVQAWLAPFEHVEHALQHLLSLSREQHQASDIIAEKGFYQGVAEGVSLLRMELSADIAAYPTISGHKHRFAIKFISTTQGDCPNIPLRLYCCKMT